MSSYYEVVFSLFLRDDTPDEVLAELRWHLGQPVQRPGLWALGYGRPLLAPGDPGPLPGGESATLDRRRGAGAWALYARLRWLDDTWGEVWWQVVAWLSRHAEDGYAGFYREEDDDQPTSLLIRDGIPYLCEFGGRPRAFSS